MIVLTIIFRFIVHLEINFFKAALRLIRIKSWSKNHFKLWIIFW